MKIYERPRGFTLVELLVVIAIIAVLASLIMVAGSAAFRAARESATRLEMTNIERALEAYKTKYGEYPPDFSDYDAFVRHFKKRWPRVNFETYFNTKMPTSQTDFTGIKKITKDTTDAINASLLTSFPYNSNDFTFPAEIKLSALAFWLGGLPDPDDPTMLAGFGPSDDPLCIDMTIATPARSANFSNVKLREKPLYDFSVTSRNLPDKFATEGYRYLIYEKPVAYFRGTTLTTREAKSRAYLQDRTNNYNVPNNPSKHIEFKDAAGNDDKATPYALDAKTPATKIDWHNANSFQLIHPGADGKFSDATVTPARTIADTDEQQTGLTFEDLDNITNCGSSATIQGIIGK